MGEAPHHYLIFETTGGFCGIAWNNVGITRFQLPTKSAVAAERTLLRRVPGAERSAPIRDRVRANPLRTGRLGAAAEGDHFPAIARGRRQSIAGRRIAAARPAVRARTGWPPHADRPDDAGGAGCRRLCLAEAGRVRGAGKTRWRAQLDLLPQRSDEGGRLEGRSIPVQ